MALGADGTLTDDDIERAGVLREQLTVDERDDAPLVANGSSLRQTWGHLGFTRDLAFELGHMQAYGDADKSYDTEAVRKGIEALRAADVPPQYRELVDARIAKGQAVLDRKEEEAAEAERRKATRTKQAPSGSFMNYRGGWALRVTGNASEGDTITVRKKDGSSEKKTLGALLEDRGDFQVFEIERDRGV
jgi:hypothetical protein